MYAFSFIFIFTLLKNKKKNGFNELYISRIYYFKSGEERYCKLFSFLYNLFIHAFIAINSKSFLEDLLNIKINNEIIFVTISIVFNGLNLGRSL